MATKAAKKSSAKKSAPKKDVSKTYNEFKSFEGQQYTHRWQENIFYERTRII